MKLLSVVLIMFSLSSYAMTFKKYKQSQQKETRTFASLVKASEALNCDNSANDFTDIATEIDYKRMENIGNNGDLMVLRRYLNSKYLKCGY